MCETVNGSNTTFAYTTQNDCRRPNSNTIDAVVIAHNGADDVAFAVMPGITLASAGNTPVNFPGGWRTDWNDMQIDYTNVPAGMTTGTTSFGVSVHGYAYIPAPPVSSTVNPGDSISRSYRFVNGLAPDVGYSFEAYYGESRPRAVGTYQKLTSLTASTTVDLSATLLPAVTGVAIADETTVRPRLTWTQAGTHEMAAAGEGYALGSAGMWSVLFPPDQAETSVTFPALPDELAAFRPDASFGSAFKNVTFRWMSYAPDYDTVRQVSGPFLGEEYETVSTRFPGDY